MDSADTNPDNLNAPLTDQDYTTDGGNRPDLARDTVEVTDDEAQLVSTSIQTTLGELGLKED